LKQIGGYMKFTENETTEFKKSTSELKEAVISLGAMLNKHCKGTVYFGIDDNGRILGQQIGKSTIKDISRLQHFYALKK